MLTFFLLIICQFNGKKIYTQHEINLLRSEWVDFVNTLLLQQVNRIILHLVFLFHILQNLYKAMGLDVFFFFFCIGFILA